MEALVAAAVLAVFYAPFAWPPFVVIVSYLLDSRWQRRQVRTGTLDRPAW